MNFLFKFPSRGRPEKFKTTLEKHLSCLSGNHNYKFIFSFDNDDPKMKNQEIIDFLDGLKIDYKVYYGDNKNKIEAINANLKYKRFDVLVLIADDMIPVIPNYDEVIYELLSNSEHGLDSMVHFYTGRWADILDIWCIMGKKYFNRFNYIYHPDYKSIFCDNEYTEVAKMLDRRIFSVISPFEHVHQSGDETEVKNWQYNNEDWQVYERRKKINFGLSDNEMINKTN